MGLDDLSSVIGFSVEANVEGISGWIDRLEMGLDAIYDLTMLVRDFGRQAQAMAVRNVSGMTIQYSGGTFIINRQTGKLARSIQIVPMGSPLATSVVASANYASAVENGSPARDMKAALMGKVVPIPVRGGAAAKREAIASGNATAVQKFTSSGRKAGTEAIMFRKIGPNSKGWIIPAQRGRPFMQATAEAIQPLFQTAVEKALAKYLNG